MDKRIVKTLNYIEEHLSQSFTLDELAAFACLSPSQFHRLFKKETGSTPFQFSENIKMQFAYEQITAGNTKVANLAEKLGYKDYETFSRAFKKHFHLSPDDIKAIALKIRDELQTEEQGKMVIATFETEEDVAEFASNKLLQIAEENEYSIDELRQAKVFKISKKSTTSNTNRLVKNKYEISSETKVWQKLINRI